VTKPILKLVVLVFSFILFACGHDIKKADLPATANPNEEITRLESDLNKAQEQHLDVLAPEDYKKAQKALADAKEGQRDQDSQADILEDVGYGQAYLARARGTAAPRRPVIEGLLKSRESALAAGARDHAELRETLGKIDDDLRDEVDDVGKISPAEFSNFQKRYSDLELASLKVKNLGTAHSQIRGAKDRKAEKNAPKTLHQAELDYTTAENAISANRNDPSRYKSAVDKANESAGLLVAVLDVAQKDSNNVLDEQTAVNIVAQNRKITALQSELGSKENQAKQLGQELRSQERELANATATVSMQEAIESARRQFSEDEAEVYQQGDKLVIRLKAIKFPTARADLPAESMELLGKVRDVANELDPKSVVVEGHTDSTGGAALNDSLSQKRAEAVMSYLKSNGMEEAELEAHGYGFKKPIASNKSPEGRAQNRRVDIIVTPSVVE
jgi:OmpA-OmpF porin, OOP family